MSITYSENDSELPDLQETASAPASQDNEGFIRPRLPPKKKRQNKDIENVILRQMLERQREEAKRQRKCKRHLNRGSWNDKYQRCCGSGETCDN